MAHNDSKALLDVWAWKEKTAEAVANLPVGERIRFIIARTQQTVDELEMEGKLIHSDR